MKNGVPNKYKQKVHQNYNFDDFCTDFISFSSLRACPISPPIFSFPLMKADIEFSSPLNILPKSSLLIFIVHVAAGAAGSSFVTLPVRDGDSDFSEIGSCWKIAKDIYTLRHNWENRYQAVPGP